MPILPAVPTLFPSSFTVIPLTLVLISHTRFIPLPKNVVAVTELIPDIFVELSPIIFPFAFIFPLTF